MNHFSAPQIEWKSHIIRKTIETYLKFLKKLFICVDSITFCYANFLFNIKRKIVKITVLHTLFLYLPKVFYTFLTFVLFYSDLLLKTVVISFNR